MTELTISEARKALLDLPEKLARKPGRAATITRHGRPVAKVSGIKPAPKRITKETIEWLDKHRVKGKIPDLDSGALVSRMRDEEWVERLLRR